MLGGQTTELAGVEAAGETGRRVGRGWREGGGERDGRVEGEKTLLKVGGKGISAAASLVQKRTLQNEYKQRTNDQFPIRETSQQG